jgi:RNA recognition motif-containing protein
MMENKLYVGNLPYSFNDNDMERAFSAYGSVNSAKVIMDRESGRSKGFGFVEMSSAAEAQAAVAALHGSDLGGRDMVVNIAKPMESRPPRSGGGGYGGGGNRY